MVPVLRGSPRNPDRASAWPVLVVDDDAQSLTAIGAILRQAGFRVVEARDAATALARAADRAFACAVLDVDLPDRTGFDLCRQLLGTERWAATPVIFCSARVAGPGAREWMTPGGFAYVSKPCRAADLLAAVGGALAPARRSPASGATPDRAALLRRAERAVLSWGPLGP